MSNFTSQKIRVAKKNHKCELCGKTITKGDKYSYESGRWEGEFFERKLCQECYNILCAFCKANGFEEFNWWDITDWLNDKYCANCKSVLDGSCKIKPEECELVRKHFTGFV